MLLFLNIYHQKYFDLLDFIPRFVQTINLQIYYKHYEKDTITTIRMLIRRNKPCTSTGNSERNRYLKRKQRTGNRSFRIGKRNNQWNNHRHQWSVSLTNISPTNKTIIVSFIGMETQEVTIKPEMKIVMTSTTEVMEEVLVVAYGTAKKISFYRICKNDSYRTNN